MLIFLICHIEGATSSFFPGIDLTVSTSIYFTQYETNNFFYNQVIFESISNKPAIIVNTKASINLLIESSFFYNCSSYSFAGAIYIISPSIKYVMNRVCAFGCFVCTQVGGQLSYIQTSAGNETVFSYFSMARCSPLGIDEYALSGIEQRYSLSQIKNCNISKNRAKRFSGFCFNSIAGSIQITYSQFIDNFALDYGVINYDYSSLSLSNGYVVIKGSMYGSNNAYCVYSNSRIRFNNSVFLDNHLFLFYSANNNYICLDNCFIKHQNYMVFTGGLISYVSCSPTYGEYLSLMFTDYYNSYLCIQDSSNQIIQMPTPFPSPSQCAIISNYYIRDFGLLPIVVSLSVLFTYDIYIL